MSIAGVWHLVIGTPIGTQRVEVTLTCTAGNTWEGRAVDAVRGGDAIPLTDIAVDGDQVSWRQSITKPLRLNLVFTLTVDGDTLNGTAKAGRLPASTVTGTRSEIVGA